MNVFPVLGWEWHRWDDFPPHEKLFKPLQIVREQGYNPVQGETS